jgi:phosphoglycolate phosphatase
MNRGGVLSGATIVFDLDGTLVDTAPDLMGALNHLLTRDGLPPLPRSAAGHLVGQGAKALLVRGFGEAGEMLEEPRLSGLYDEFIVHYLAHIADESRPFEGAIEAMDELQAGGALLSVCTNKSTDLSLALLNALGLTDRFDAVVGADLAPAAKPDPRHLWTAIDLAGGAGARAVMVGDSASDARAARNAGVPLVLVSFGYTDVPAKDLEPDVLIDSFTELPEACERLLSRR